MARPRIGPATGPDFTHETRLGGRVAGIDEAGRGPWAGPVVAAAVILSDAAILLPALAGLNDSKKLAAPRRDSLCAGLHAAQAAGSAVIGVGMASVDEIDRLNILAATLLAMRRAVDSLPAAPDHALVDGNRLPELACPAEALVGGDGRSLSIAAASIVAKVTRDRIMADLAGAFPGYGWERNAGYGTAQHRAGLARLGPCDHHRRSFAPIRALLTPTG
jgi:ribonuclease HII